MKFVLKYSVFILVFLMGSLTLLAEDLPKERPVPLVPLSQLMDDAELGVSESATLLNDDATEDVVYDNELSDNAQLERIPSKDTLIFSLDVVKEAIKTDRYAVAVSKLRELLDQLKLARQQALGAFFPEQFDGFLQSKRTNAPGYFTQVVDDYGVVLTRHFTGKDNQKVDVNLVYADPSIRDYMDTINSPKLIKSLDGVKLIRIDNDYKGLQKFSEEDQTCEYNIVVSDDILVNIIAIGVSSPKALDALLDGIDFSAIKLFLE